MCFRTYGWQIIGKNHKKMTLDTPVAPQTARILLRNLAYSLNQQGQYKTKNWPKKEAKGHPPKSRNKLKETLNQNRSLWYRVEFQNAKIWVFYLRAPFILPKLILVFLGVSEMHCLCGDWLPFVPFWCSVVHSGLERLEDKGRKWDWVIMSFSWKRKGSLEILLFV